MQEIHVCKIENKIDISSLWSGVVSEQTGQVQEEGEADTRPGSRLSCPPDTN